MKRDWGKKEEITEDCCFICKDGGLLLVCEYKRCLKAYHPECVGKDSTILDTNNPWICSWHSCFICKKSSKFQCFCCPSAVCQACTRTAEFVQVQKKKGFCNNCLKLALLIEENVDVDSDGGQIDFKDTETYEFLFKDYWEIIKQNESLSLEDLHKADALLKKGETNVDVFNSDKSVGDEEDLISDFDIMDYKSGDEIPLVEKEPKGQDVWMKIGKKKYKSRKKKFIGWGSEELIGFLTSIGKNTDEPISQLEVYDIIKDYIAENKLIHPQRKKKVLCDVRLKSLFGRKAVNRLRISNLLEAHFAESQVSEDDSLFGSEEENVTKACKRQRKLSSDPKTHIPVLNNVTRKVSETPKSCYASIIAKNVKLVYLRRSLIEEFLKTPETFESTVMDCFVRVKSDPNDFSVPKNSFRLMQVTGTGRASEAYKTGEISTDVVLQVSNMMKDIHIFMLSDDDFSEEECEDLRQRVKEGLLKKLTVVELDKKAKSLHEDITNHWIDREIVMLQKRIDRANEKGWRRDLLDKLNHQWGISRTLVFSRFDSNQYIAFLFEYIERRELLQTPSERSRLLKELPKVIADAEMELEATPNSPEDAEVANEGNEKCANQIDADRENEGNGTISLLKARSAGTKGWYWAADNKAAERETEEIGATFIDSSPHGEGHGPDSNQLGGTRDIKGNGAISLQKAGKTGTEESTSSIYSFFFGNRSAPDDEVAKNEAEAMEATTIAPKPDTAMEATTIVPKPEAEEQCENKESSREKQLLKDVIDLDEDEKFKLVIPVIDLDDDNDEDPNDVSELTTSKTVEKADATTENNQSHIEEEKQVELNPECRKIWHYIDPNGEIQGPFSMLALTQWKRDGYFNEEFKVWITGRSPEDAILLTDAIRLTVV